MLIYVIRYSSFLKMKSMLLSLKNLPKTTYSKVTTFKFKWLTLFKLFSIEEKFTRRSFYLSVAMWYMHVLKEDEAYFIRSV